MPGKLTADNNTLEICNQPFLNIYSGDRIAGMLPLESALDALLTACVAKHPKIRYPSREH